MNVYDTANKLAQEIKESNEYKEYKKVKDEIKINPELKEKIESFEKARQEMQLAMLKGGKPVEEKSAEIQNMYAELMQNDTVKTYFEAEYRFSILITDMNKIISESVKDVIKW